MPPTARDRGIDAARTLACGLVVLMHVNAYSRAGIDGWWPGGYAFAPLFCLTVPAFLIMAGFLHAGTDARSREGAWLGTRLRRLLLPMVAWSAVMLALGANAGVRSPTEVLLDLTTGVQHLYYLGVLAQLTLVGVLLDRGRRSWADRRVLVLAAVVSIGTLTLSDAALWTGADALGFTEGWLRRLCLPWAVFFAFGAWLRQRRGSLVLEPRALTALTAATVTGWALYVVGFRFEDRIFGFTPRTELLLAGLPFQLAGAWLLLALTGAAARTRAGPAMDRLAAAAPETYGVYLVHFPVLIVCFRLWTATGLSRAHWAEVPVFWAIVWVLSLLLVRAIRRVPWPAAKAVLLGEGAGVERQVRLTSASAPSPG